MIAVKEAIGTPENVFLPMVIVDTIVPYVWMGVLIALAGFQPVFDKWNRADRKIIDELAAKHIGAHLSKKEKLRFDKLLLIFFIVIFGMAISRYLSGFLPEIKDVISRYAWTIIIASFIGILLSFTNVKKLENHGASKIGYFLLYFVLASIGAKAEVISVGPVITLIIAGFLVVLFHAVILLLTARLIKAPLFLVAVASQANIGGVASAPIIASVYQPGLASIGLLLAVLGNIIGTYLGILTSQLCRLAA
ncbi:MAG TPA: DUF819 family protein, partial [Candidatus Omnitrophota bacterium]|nr:DUF819 family protein [Candidatus Omnitrophota bacterium]